MKQLTPMQEAIEKVTELHNKQEIIGFTKRAYAICLDILTELLPKEQQVIEENNNGWIKIESDEDLPKEDCRCWVFDDGVIYEDDFYLKYNSFQNEVLYYKPIIKPKPPIF